MQKPTDQPIENQSRPGADAVDPKKYLGDLNRGDVRFEPESLAEWLRTSRVFFYPAAGLEDWYPLHFFTRADAGEMQCGLFVCCDWAMTAPDFERAIQEKLNRQAPAGSRLECRAVENVRPEDLGVTSVRANLDFLSKDEKDAYQEKYEQFAVREPWGRLAEIVREDQHECHRFPLLYLCAEGVATYLKLFVKQAILPHALCIKNPGVGFGYGWTQFHDWAAPLGRAVVLGAQRCGGEPKYLITDRAHSWPWTESVKLSTGWATVHKRPEPGGTFAGAKRRI